MKREHFIEQNYIDYLKSLGCVFYAPLDSTNGLTELITNTTGTVQYNSTAVWDNNENAYLFTKSSAYSPKQGIVIWENLGMDLATTNPNTSLLCKLNISRFGSSWNGVADDANSTINFATGDRKLLYSPQSINIQKNIWCCFAQTLDLTNLVQSRYLDGVLAFQASVGGGSITSNDKNILYINQCTNHQGYTNAVFYAKELMLFNTALDVNTIRQIQGL